MPFLSCFIKIFSRMWPQNDIDIILNNNIRICNLFTEPLKTIEIIKLFDYPIENFNTSSTVSYNTKTKYDELCFAGGCFILNKCLINIYTCLYDEKLQYYFYNK